MAHCGNKVACPAVAARFLVQSCSLVVFAVLACCPAMAATACTCFAASLKADSLCVFIECVGLAFPLMQIDLEPDTGRIVGLS
jgi:hypothetical protein